MATEKEKDMADLEEGERWEGDPKSKCEKRGGSVKTEKERQKIKVT